MKIYAVIHARGGSKRIPLKNIKELDGKPLIAYPIDLCHEVSAINRVIVSTDHDGIKTVSEKYGAEVPFKRPVDISEDVASELVTLHTLEWLKDSGDLPDIIVTLTPATPFTEVVDLENAIQLLQGNDSLDSVITVRKAKEFAEWMIDIDSSGVGSTVLGNSFDGKYNVSQNLPRRFYPMGAFFVNRVASFLEKPSMYGKRWGCVELDPMKHVDIDEPEDFEEAERIFQNK